MKLDELRTVQSKERRKDSLQQLRDSFYEDVAAYIRDLKASRDRRAKQVEDPFSDDEVRRLSDELETAEEVAEAVYERRVGKVVKLASFAAADMPVDDEGMTTEERDLFEDLVDRIEQNKHAVLDVLSGNGESAEQAGDTAADVEPTPPPSPTERVAESEPATESAADGMLADAMGSGSEPTAETPDQATPEAATEPTAPGAVETDPTDSSPDEIPPPEAEPEPDAVLGTSTDGGTAADVASDAPGGDTPADQPPTASAGGDAEAVDASPESTDANPDPTDERAASSDDDGEDRTTVRITKNVGEIFGVDGREYTLRSEDVVSLPTTNADPLVDRDAAMRLD